MTSETTIPEANTRLLGAHMPTAGGLYKSLRAGKAIGCNVIQLFTGSPKQWGHPPLSDETIAAFRDAQEQTGIDFTVAHDSYLINLAAPDAANLTRSRGAFRAELERAESLGIRWVVTHMGSHLGKGVDEAVARLVESLRGILEETDAKNYKVGIALETTAGQGTGLGATFEELRDVLQGVGPHPRLGVCLDTCHVFVAGYDLRTPEVYAATWADFDAKIGRGNLKVIHANDAKKPLGSRADRHEHIGEGEIGAEAFRMLVTDPHLRHVPVIVETPDSETMHAVNLARLQRMARGEAGDELRVTVQFFGHYSDYFPNGTLPLLIPPDSRLADVAALLAAHDARLDGLEKHCRFALNEEYAALDAALTHGAAIAVLPPMSGG